MRTIHERDAGDRMTQMSLSEDGMALTHKEQLCGFINHFDEINAVKSPHFNNTVGLMMAHRRAETCSVDKSNKLL
jgi:hypothetical protein